MPRAVTHVSIRSDRGLIDLKDVVASDLYAYLVEDDLNTLGYPALLAGVSFEVATPPRGFRVTLEAIKTSNPCRSSACSKR